MNTIELLTHMRERDIKLWVEEDRLKFSAAQGALTSDLRATLVERKSEIISFLQEASATTRPMPPAIEAAERDSDLPLSFGQQRLWVMDQLAPGEPSYNIPVAVRLTGELNRPALNQALNSIVKRHEILRTTFSRGAAEPSQVIHEPRPVSLFIRDLRALTSAPRALDEEGEHGQQEDEVRRLVTDEIQQPFDLEAGPLLRAVLIRLADHEHVLVLTMHHIVSDGWSLGVLLREMQTLYGAFVQGNPSPLPPLPIQYADYAAWQRKWLQADVLAEHLDYWRSRLSDAPADLPLPTDRPRPAVQSTRGAKQARLLPIHMQQSLRELGQREGTTLFMTLLAAFQTLLYRITHQSDICVGTPVAGRTQPETEALIGCFINTLVMRTDLGGEPSFRTLLKQVKEVALGAFAHQELPFEKLVTELSPSRDTSRPPLFQVMFILQNTHGPHLVSSSRGRVHDSHSSTGRDREESLSIRPLKTDIGTANFDITLTMAESAQGLAASVEYSTDLFDAETIERLLARFEQLLSAIIAQPDQSIMTLLLLLPKEENQLAAWNETATLFPHEQLIHQLFEEEVEARPDAIAVIDGNAQISYAQLNAQANQLAYYLRSKGVETGDLVGISLPRSIEMIVGLLGILKTGAAYLPLDPTYPDEALNKIQDDAKPRLILVQPMIQAALVDPKFECVNPQLKIECASLAYVIYTSGSTGKPKGVEIPHRSVVNHTYAARKLFGLSAADRVLQFATLNFDTAVEEIFPTLLTGATLVLRGTERVIAGSDLLDLVRRHQLTMLDLPTAYWHAWVAELEMEQVKSLPPSLRLVILGGDKASAERFMAWNRHGGAAVELMDTYGPTETTIIATAYRPDEAERARNDLHDLPIGRPIANTQIHLVDAQLRPVPIGVVGELLIGGECVGRGYLNQPMLTAEKFIPDPFGAEPGARLYRTGDLARYRPDGQIEFLGRADHQVKVRGFRVELGAIEEVLLGHAAVQEAVVIAKADSQPADKRLIAYCAVRPAVSVGATNGVAPQTEGDAGSRGLVARTMVEELRSYLKDRLPEYMIPAAFVLLDALPYTPSNKIDRRALPEPDVESSPSTADFVAPQSEAEVLLTDLWQKVLGRTGIGIHDNFFALGGDSILGIQVVAQARQKGLHLKPVHLFQHQTIAELALVATSSDAVSIQAEQGIVTGAVPLTPIQHWFFEQSLVTPHHWNQSILLEVRETIDPALLEAAIWQLLRHHDALRMRFSQGDMGWSQVNVGLDDGNEAPFTCIDCTLVEDEALAHTIEAEAAALQASLQLTTGPLLRVAYFGLGAQRPARLLIVAHHLVVDGVSWRVLLEDLHVVYQQLVQNQPVQLPPKTTSFQQWAQRLVEHATSAACQAELAYWTHTLDTWIDPLPVDVVSPSQTTCGTEASAETVVELLDATETETLLREVPAAYRTQINDVLLTALVRAFGRWTGRRQLLIDMEGHGREDLFDDMDLSRTVGWFTAIFPVLLDLGRTVGEGDALQAIKEQLNAIPNRGVGYGLLRYLAQDEDDDAELDEFPQAQVSFNYLGQLDQAVPEATPFAPARESRGPEIDASSSRAYLLDVIASVRGGQLQVRWRYSTECHNRSTIEALARGYIDELRGLIAHCTSSSAGGITPSDFDLAKLDNKKLDKVLAQLGKK